MDRLMPFDELNTIRPIVTEIMGHDAEERKRYLDYLEDIVLEVLILSYLYGNEAANYMLAEDMPTVDSKLFKSIRKAVAGETWLERIRQHLESGTVEDIMRVIVTESHRIYNEALFAVAREAEAKGVVVYKRWETMLDDKVRDTHYYLQGDSQPLNEPFFTYDGDFAMHPGDFTFPENNIGCRCRLVFTRVFG